MDNGWPVQDAKARFSEFLRQAETSVIKDKSRQKAKPRTLIDWWLSAPTVPEFRLPPRRR